MLEDYSRLKATPLHGHFVDPYEVTMKPLSEQYVPSVSIPPASASTR